MHQIHTPHENRNAELLQQYRRGRTHAFTALYDAYAPFVRWSLRNTLPRALYSTDGDDLTQEVFIRLANGSPPLPTDADITRWLTTITRNLAISSRRKCRPRTNCAIFDQP